MRVLNEVQTDSVGGGLVMGPVWDAFIDYFYEFSGGSGGNPFTNNTYSNGNMQSSDSSSPSGGYGSNMVNPAACNQDVFNTTLVGVGIGGAAGAYFGRNAPAAGLGAVVGGGLGMFYGLKTSPNCAPK